MKYCPNCKRIFEEGEVCPHCDNKEIRKPENDDKILILTADPEAASLIIDRFNIAEIDFETVDIERLGDSPFSGKAFIPDCEIYVYYRDYETSELILNDVFKEIETLNAPPTAKGVLSQAVSIGLFVLMVMIAIFAADLIVGIFK